MFKKIMFFLNFHFTFNVVFFVIITNMMHFSWANCV